MMVDLVHTTTRDGLRLDGVFQDLVVPSLTPVDGWLLVHGTGSNFYSALLLEEMARRLLALSGAVLRVNTRGHDLICTLHTSRGGRRGGAAYESLDDCRLDLAAWISWLGQKGLSRVGLLGHSMGALKCLYSQAQEPSPLVSVIVALSPPRLSYSRFLASQKAEIFQKSYQQAEELSHQGRAGALMEVSFPLPMVICAGGYLDKYGPDEHYDYMKFLPGVTVPTLIAFGSQEVMDNPAFQGAPEALAGLKSPQRQIQTLVLEGADHHYTDRRDGLFRAIRTWLLGLNA